ncbi:hypothetical protein [Sandarakinorhabdus sp. DWP1-3-1]|uniref:hypothetical protein n=1 Tax=Sandarakinorhabdus sp. DWP1-3-1 TaxID=2804627 RepID=UPI003CFB07F8
MQRQQGNLGTTLVDAGRAGAALPLLSASRAGWLAMAAADPQDESVASWVRTTRLSYGEGLAAAGRTGDAIVELSASLADRRRWLATQPQNAERRRALVVGLNALGDALAAGGRQGEACGLFAEADTMIRCMAGAGSLTRLDADSLQAILRQSIARHCPSGTPT